MMSVRRFSQALRHPARRRRGFSLVELTISAAIGSMLAIAILTSTILSSQMAKATFSQQRAIHDTKSITETLNREIHLAATPLAVFDEAGQPAPRGFRVDFSRPAEPGVTRRIELISGDGDWMTALDNRLVFDPDITIDGNEVELARGITPIVAAGIFAYGGARTPLAVQLRRGDPVGGDADSDLVTGRGVQGVEINLTVSPRN